MGVLSPFGSAISLLLLKTGLSAVRNLARFFHDQIPGTNVRILSTFALITRGQVLPKLKVGAVPEHNTVVTRSRALCDDCDYWDGSKFTHNYVPESLSSETSNSKPSWRKLSRKCVKYAG